MSSGRNRKPSKRANSQASLTKDDGIELDSSLASWSSMRTSHNEDGDDEVDYAYDNPAAEIDATDGVTNESPDLNEENVEKVGKIRGMLAKIWKPRLPQVIGDAEIANELLVISSIRELCIYMGFLVTLCVMNFGVTSPTTFYFKKGMTDLFVNGPGFNDFTMMKDFWKYTEKPLLNGLYWDKYYSKEPVRENEQGYVLFANKLLGSPRLRQLRVSNRSCSIAKEFRGEVKECFSSYSSSAESEEPFGLMNGAAWNYQSSKKLKTGGVWGHIASYSGGGYVELLGFTRANATAKIEKLKQNLWLDKATRAVFIEFTVYNANVNLFCVVTLTWEFPATGGLIPSAHIHTLKLLRYVSTMDAVVFGFEVVFFLYLLFYTMEELTELRIHGKSYFSMSAWNFFDAILILFGYITVFFTIYVYVEVKDLLHYLLEVDREQFANFSTLASHQNLFNQFSAVFFFLAMVKIFKFMTFNRTMTLLQITMSTCAKDIAGFSVMFFIVFLAYTLWGNLMFGTQAYDFSSYQRSIYTLFRIILGDFDFPAIEQANRILGPIYFISYVFIVFFILINMFLAIINDTYAEEKENQANSNVFLLGDYFKKGYNKMLNKLRRKKDNIADIMSAINNADNNHDDVVDFEEWKAELRSRGHAEEEIEAVFSRYDLDGDRVLNSSELAEMNENLEKEKADLNEEMRGIKQVDEDMERLSTTSSILAPYESDYTESKAVLMTRLDEFDVLRSRVDRMQGTVGAMIYKIDSLLMKIDAMNDAKRKRRETMNRLLDGITGEEGKAEVEDRRNQLEKLVHDELEKWDVEMDRKDEDKEEDV